MQNEAFGILKRHKKKVIKKTDLKYFPMQMTFPDRGNRELVRGHCRNWEKLTPPVVRNLEQNIPLFFMFSVFLYVRVNVRKNQR